MEEYGGRAGASVTRFGLGASFAFGRTPAAPMTWMRRVSLAALLAETTIVTAADARVQPNLKSARAIAAAGKYEMAIRMVDQGLARSPGDPEGLELRRQFVEAAARAAGNAAPAQVASNRLAAIPGRSPEPGKNFTVETAGIAQIWLAPGTVLLRNPMGSDDDTWVTLTRGYWLGRTEVTQEQLHAVMEHLPPQSNFRGSDRPAEHISWLNAMEFGRLITERAAGRLPPGYEYTLPTEAQWEYACRAGTTGPHAGELAEMAWFGANSDAQTHPVGQKQPNAWGLYDLHGNVSEWCADGFHGYPGGRVTDLMIGYDGRSAAMVRMVRGGGWSNSAGQCRSGVRYQYQINYVGSGVASGWRSCR